MKKHQIVNIINFIRACEPRSEVDLLRPIQEQLKLLKKYSFPGTFLLQYDALIDPSFCELLKNNSDDHIELGVWLEIVQPMVQAVGIKWNGRYPWDWHAHCGFSVGYTLRERERLIDVLMDQFKAVFGYYPRSMGSWTIDAHSLAYASDKYGLDASCNCKDQWGTDGYTMWGGYYNQAYYPSRNNMFAPAGSPDLQINTPIFRMLGSDPIYQYDFGLDVNTTADECQGVVTLEPVYCSGTGGGGVPAWVDWYFKENFNGKCLAFSYTQAGQENSFGWDRMKDGLCDQFKKIDALQKEGSILVETLGDSGRWFKNTFKETPATTIVADTDWAGADHKTVWYNCKNYRLNLYCEGDHFWIRDLYLFRDGFRELYVDEVCDKEYLIYDNLPLMDGNRFSGNGIRAGLYPFLDGKQLCFQSMDYKEVGTDAVVTFTGTACGEITFLLCEAGIRITGEGESSFELHALFDKSAKQLPSLEMHQNSIHLNYRGFPYSIIIEQGSVDMDDRPVVRCINSTIQVKLI